MFLSILQDTITDAEKQEICDYVYPKMEYEEQDVNLHKISKYKVSNNSPDVIKKTNHYIKTEIEKIVNLKLYTRISHIINYTAGARADTHRDNHNLSYVTAVTFLNLSDDMEGGVSYVARKIDGNVSRLYVPVIEKDTLIYGSKMLHGVTEITKGSRLVFINWYKVIND
jgi:predicted 2-oxoglutarate/Fe(II)-dependent dioxygenase YbiX